MASNSKIAIVTMVYNEPDFLPFWQRYYGREVGAQHCYIVDHGSTDGSTDQLGEFNRLRIPRSPMDESRRSGFISEFCSSLLRWYDFVAYCDVDEFLVADPARFSSLADFCAQTDLDVVTAFGFNVVHWLHHELPIDPARPILSQRRWVHPISSMSKPLLTRRPIDWPGGFHSWNGPARFDGLFNFHMAYMDLDIALRRQAKRRSVEWAQHWSAAHHLDQDDTIVQRMEAASQMPKVENITLDSNCTSLRRFINRIRLSQHGRDSDPYKTEMNIWGASLWQIPERFRSVV